MLFNIVLCQETPRGGSDTIYASLECTQTRVLFSLTGLLHVHIGQKVLNANWIHDPGCNQERKYVDLVSLFSVNNIVKKKINETKVVGFFFSVYLSVCLFVHPWHFVQIGSWGMTLCHEWTKRELASLRIKWIVSYLLLGVGVTLGPAP